MSGEERGYLTRQSIIRPGFFILSFQEGGNFIHHVAPNREGKYNKQTYDEAALVLSEMILAKEECEEPLSPTNGVIYESRPCPENQNTKCKACRYTNENARRLSDHEKVHYVRKCLCCQKFIKNSTFHSHKIQCASLPVQELFCDMEHCNFSTYHDSSLRRHRKRHEISFPCAS